MKPALLTKIPGANAVRVQRPDQACRSGRDSEIEFHNRNLGVVFTPQFVRQRLQPLAAARNQRHRVPVTGEDPGKIGAYATRSAGYQRWQFFAATRQCLHHDPFRACPPRISPEFGCAAGFPGPPAKP